MSADELFDEVPGDDPNYSEALFMRGVIEQSRLKGYNSTPRPSNTYFKGGFGYNSSRSFFGAFYEVAGLYEHAEAINVVAASQWLFDDINKSQAPMKFVRFPETIHPRKLSKFPRIYHLSGFPRAEAMLLFKKAASLGSLNAKHNLALVYLYWAKGLENRVDQMDNLREDSSSRSYSGKYSEFINKFNWEEKLLKYPETFEGLTETALSLLKECAESGHGPSLYRLGKISEAQQKPEEAFEYYKIAAEKDIPSAMWKLAGYYEGKEEYTEAKKWAKEAFRWTGIKGDSKKSELYKRLELKN